MTYRRWFLSLTAAGLLAGAPTPLLACQEAPAAILAYRTPSLETARGQALDWLKSAGKTDEASQRAFQAIWEAPDRQVIDRVADTLALGNADAARLLADVRDPFAAAPKQVPALLKDRQQPAFFRANLALAYAKALSSRRIYEEALETLQGVKVDEVIDPAAYFFHRAVAEFALRQRDPAKKSIARLGDVADAPERYQAVAALMNARMMQWKDKDLGWIADKMDNAGRRLDLARGGPQTQKLQREVIDALDELIRRREPPPVPPGPDDPNPPPPPPPGPKRPGPFDPTNPGGNKPPSGPGDANKEIARIVGQWGKLPEKDRAAAMIELIRNLPPAQRQAIEDYYKQIARSMP